MQLNHRLVGSGEIFSSHGTDYFLLNILSTAILSKLQILICFIDSKFLFFKFDSFDDSFPSVGSILNTIVKSLNIKSLKIGFWRDEGFSFCLNYFFAILISSLRREYPPISLIELQRLIDLGWLDPTRLIDITALCNTQQYHCKPSLRQFGVQLTDEVDHKFSKILNLFFILRDWR